MTEQDLKNFEDVRTISESEFDRDPRHAFELTKQGYRVAVVGDQDRSVQMILGARTAYNAED